MRPEDLPEAVAEMREWSLVSGPQWFGSDQASQSIIGAVEPRIDPAHFLSTQYASHLGLAEKFYVPREMTALIVEAAKSLPPFSLNPDDVPCTAGLVYYEGLTETRGGVSTTALLWAPAPVGVIRRYLRAAHGGGVWVTHLSPASYFDPLPEGLRVPLLPTGPAVLPYAKAKPGDYGMIWDDTTDTPVRVVDPHLASAGATPEILRATWLLMTQGGVVEAREARLPRASRKRAVRMGCTDNHMRVRVLDLHRRLGGGGSSADREYHHRWIVRGHWRNQWYASREEHRPVWISPHVKGPDGAPILGGEKVYTLKGSA